MENTKKKEQLNNGDKKIYKILKNYGNIYEYGIRDLVITSNEKHLITISEERHKDSTISFWNLKTGILLGEWTKLGDIRAVCITKDNENAYFGSWDGNIHHFIIKTQQFVDSYKYHDSICLMKLSLDGKLLASTYFYNHMEKAYPFHY